MHGYGVCAGSTAVAPHMQQQQQRQQRQQQRLGCLLSLQQLSRTALVCFSSSALSCFFRVESCFLSGLFAKGTVRAGMCLQ
jgi:hypothetical protein